MDKTDDNKIILKRSELPGIDMSLVDLEIVGTVKVRVTIIKKKMYVVKGKTFIGTRDQLDNMDVIQLGNFGIKYRVMSLEKMTDYEGYIYRIKRLDGYNTTDLDINATEVGQKVKIVNRQSFEQLFAYACSMREEIPIPTTVDLSRTLACEGCGIKTTQSHPPIPDPTPDPEPECPPEGCTTYSMLATSYYENNTFQYTNCSGELAVWNPNTDGFEALTDDIITLQFCGVNGQDFSEDVNILLVFNSSNCGLCEDNQPCQNLRVNAAEGDTITSIYVKCNGFPGVVNFTWSGGDGGTYRDICVRDNSTFVHTGSEPASIENIGEC